MNIPPSTPRSILSAALLMGTLLISGCYSVPERTPLYASPSFHPAEITEISILPVADLRADKSALPDPQKQIFAGFRGRRGSPSVRNFPAVLIENATYLPLNVTEADLEKPPVEWVKSLPTAGARWVLVIAVHDIRKNITFGSTGNAEISGYLYDKQTGELVWHDKGIGQAGQGGLIGMAMVGAMASEALNGAINNLFTGFPYRPKAK